VAEAEVLSDTLAAMVVVPTTGGAVAATAALAANTAANTEHEVVAADTGVSGSGHGNSIKVGATSSRSSAARLLGAAVEIAASV
jgi:hypothetical protein